MVRRAVAFSHPLRRRGVGGEQTRGTACGKIVNYTDLAILDLLMATGDRSSEGVLYDLNGDGRTDNDSWETLLRTLANDVYTAINERGHI